MLLYLSIVPLQPSARSGGKKCFKFNDGPASSISFLSRFVQDFSREGGASFGEGKSEAAEYVDAFRVVLRAGMENDEEVEDVVEMSWVDEEEMETLLALLSLDCVSLKPTLRRNECSESHWR